MSGTTPSPDLKNKGPKSTRGHGGARAGAGRKKGVPNKLTAEVKDMILQALDKAGGAEYLYMQAHENPTAFMTLVGKVLPLQVNADHSGNVRHEVTRRIIGGDK